MNNQQRGESKKPSYQEELRARVQSWWDNDENVEADVDQLFEFVKQVALESWRNGVEAGRKRPDGTDPQSNPSRGRRFLRAPKVYGKGTALGNGKLKPVEHERAGDEA